MIKSFLKSYHGVCTDDLLWQVVPDLCDSLTETILTDVLIASADVQFFGMASEILSVAGFK